MSHSNRSRTECCARIDDRICPEGLTWLDQHLPPVETTRLRGEADFYGTSRWIASALGLREAPKSRCAWQHGWAISPLTDPRQVIGNHSFDHPILVANRKIETWLRTFGVPATAVGLPILYAPKPQVPRRADSLLVMPPHVTKHSAILVNQREYVDFIVEQRTQFDVIVACVSRQCAERGFWVDDFRRAGIPCLSGAGIDDRHALLRMKSILSQFEYVTSNAIGSHLAYAGLCDCKVSVCGPDYEMNPDELVNEPFYQQHPDLVESAVQRSRRETLFGHASFFDRKPESAERCREWAEQEVGVDCVQSPQRIAKLLRWRTLDRIAKRHAFAFWQRDRRQAA